MRYLLIILVFVGLAFGCSDSLNSTLESKKEFEINSFKLNIKEFSNKKALIDALHRDGKPYSAKERGYATWEVDQYGNPLGLCTIYVLKNDHRTLLHEINHCRWGRYHD